MKSLEKGQVFVVATPIGNMDDMSTRAVQVLKEVDLIAAEDTRHTAKLCRHWGITKPMLSMHSHNESERTQSLLVKLEQGESIAVVSDAGTPLISDPGYTLINQARQAGYTVVPIPGPCAFVAALSAAGLSCSRVVFEGFLSAKKSARASRLESLNHETGVIVFYEAPHRILDLMEDLVRIYPERTVVVARELTKSYETIKQGQPEELLRWMQEDSNQTRGEFVVMLEGASAEVKRDCSAIDVEQLVASLAKELPTKKVAAVAAEITGISKKELYAKALALKDQI